MTVVQARPPGPTLLGLGLGVDVPDRPGPRRRSGPGLRGHGRVSTTTWHDSSIEQRAPTSVDEAMTRVQAGDRAAFAVVYDALAPALFATITRVLRDPAMSEEVTQDVFTEIWRTASRFDRSQSSLSTWAITIARRRAIDRVRAEQSRRDRVERAAARSDADAEASVDETVATKVDAERVRSALATLPEPQQQVIRLAFIEGRAHGEIAERLDLPLGTVKGRVRGGLRRLRSELEGPMT